MHKYRYTKVMYLPLCLTSATKRRKKPHFSKENDISYFIVSSRQLFRRFSGEKEAIHLYNYYALCWNIA